MGEVFTILDIPFEVMEREKNYAMVSAQFNKKALEWSSEFREEFENSFSNMEDALKGVGELSSKYVEKEVQYCVDLLTGMGLYEYDEASVMEKIQEFPVFEQWSETFNNLTNEYAKITTEADLEKEYRKLRKASRGRMIGGGFGIGGAIKGMAVAGVVNATTGVLASVGNSIQNGFTDSKRNRELNKQFVGLADLLENELMVVLSNIGIIYMAILQEEGVMYFRYPSEDQQSKYQSLFNNLKQDRIPEDDIPHVVNQLLEINPYDMELYEWLLEYYGDEDGELTRMAEYLHSDLSETKADLISLDIVQEFNQISSRYDENPNLYKLLDDMTELQERIGEYYEFYGFEGNVPVEEELNKAIDKLKDGIEQIKQKEQTIKELLEKHDADTLPYMLDVSNEYVFAADDSSNKETFEKHCLFNDASEKFGQLLYFFEKEQGIDLQDEIAVFAIVHFYSSASEDYTKSDIATCILVTDKTVYIMDFRDGKEHSSLKTEDVVKASAEKTYELVFYTRYYCIRCESGDYKSLDCVDGTSAEMMKEISRFITNCLVYINPKLAEKRNEMNDFLTNISEHSMTEIVEKMKTVNLYTSSDEEAEEILDKMRTAYYERLSLSILNKKFPLNLLIAPFTKYNTIAFWNEKKIYEKCKQLYYGMSEYTVPLFAFTKDSDTYFLVTDSFIKSKGITSEGIISIKDDIQYSISTGMFGNKLIVGGEGLPIPKLFTEKHMELIKTLLSIIQSDKGGIIEEEPDDDCEVEENNHVTVEENAVQLETSESLSEEVVEVCENIADYPSWLDTSSIKAACMSFVKKNASTKGFGCEVVVNGEMIKMPTPTFPKLRKNLGIDSNQEIYVGHDDTLFKTGKNGFAITDSGIIRRMVLEKTSTVSFEQLATYQQFSIDNKTGAIHGDDKKVLEVTMASNAEREDMIVLLEYIKGVLQKK